ncbi:MAG: hypothetical protein EON52_13165 [Actinomycetales bacterium]|nr:MAG: hypothetical protein EON52_13165 [Actinomycetales bacterium]
MEISGYFAHPEARRSAKGAAAPWATAPFATASAVLGWLKVKPDEVLRTIHSAAALGVAAAWTPVVPAEATTVRSFP